MTTVCVHGLGYVGLPTAALLSHNGNVVYGVDSNPDRLAQLRGHESGFQEAELDRFVTEQLASSRLRLRETPTSADYHLICVPTPYDEERERADLSAVTSVADELAHHLRTGDTVVLESTVPPGTTAGVLRDHLESAGLEAGRDFGLAHCPETVLPGSILAELRQNERIVGGIDDSSTDAAVALFEQITESTVHRAADATTAEFVKLSQNTFRDVNIALANELAKVARDYGVDARDAFRLANTHPRVSLHDPGPGVGGHCLPIDPLYLGEHSDNVELVEHARDVNDGMVPYVCDLLLDSLDGVRNPTIAVFGVAYKGNVADTRNSPGERFSRRLDDGVANVEVDGSPQTVEVRVHDPHVDQTPADMASYAEALNGADALAVLTDHDEFAEIDPSDAAERMRGNVVLDTKGIIDADAWREQGFTVETL